MKKYIGFIICIPLFTWFEFLTLSWDLEHSDTTWQISCLFHTCFILCYIALAFIINEIIKLKTNH